MAVDIKRPLNFCLEKLIKLFANNSLIKFLFENFGSRLDYFKVKLIR